MLSCTIVIGIQPVHAVQLLAVVLVGLAVRIGRCGRLNERRTGGVVVRHLLHTGPHSRHLAVVAQVVLVVVEECEAAGRAARGGRPGNSRWRSFLIGSLSGAVEPIGAIAVLLLASLLMPVLPYMLAFAAGAMFYVVVEELIPEASTGQHSNLSTIGFAIGFVLMMVLDVVMG